MTIQKMVETKLAADEMAQGTIRPLAIQIAMEVAKIREQYRDLPHVGSVYFENEGFEIDACSVTFTWDEYARGCFMGTESFSFPTPYLWTPNYQEIEINRLVEYKIKIDEEKAAQEAVLKAKRDERDRQEYERLKARFE